MSRGDELPRGHQPRHVDGLGQRHIQLLDVDPGVRPPLQIVKKHAVLERGEKVGALRSAITATGVLSAQSLYTIHRGKACDDPYWDGRAGGFGPGPGGCHTRIVGPVPRRREVHAKFWANLRAGRESITILSEGRPLDAGDAVGRVPVPRPSTLAADSMTFLVSTPRSSG